MKRRVFLTALSALAMSPAARAGGPAILSVTETAELAAEPSEVWAAIGDFHDMSWHPAVHATTGEGTTRRLVLGGAGGPVIDEALDTHGDAERSYAYRIIEVSHEVLPVTEYASRLSVMPRAGGGSVVAWQGHFRRVSDAAEPPEALSDAAAIAAVTGVYRAGMDALVARFGAPGS